MQTPEQTELLDRTRKELLHQLELYLDVLSKSMQLHPQIYTAVSTRTLVHDFFIRGASA